MTDAGPAFILIMVGFLLQWPTVLTLIMFPILVAMYVRLAHREEREARAEFDEAYARYAATTPAFVPGCETRNEVAEDVEMALERRMAEAAR
jgi:protein-S-isoprenylcysteine O-methyltransferase Ste14